MPPLAILPALIAAGTGVAGAVEGAQAGNRQQKALSEQDQIAQQEMQDKQQIFSQLAPFFSQYLQQGNPFLQQIQRAGAEQNAQQFNNAAGNLRQTMQTSGLGYGPSGTTAAALGGLGTQAAQQGSQSYLQNLLANEQLKFQAAQGLQGIGQMAGSSQNQPNVSAQLPYQSLGTGLAGLGQILSGLSGSNGGKQQTPAGGNMGDILLQSGTFGTPPPAVPTFPGSSSGAPTTQGTWD